MTVFAIRVSDSKSICPGPGSKGVHMGCVRRARSVVKSGPRFVLTPNFEQCLCNIHVQPDYMDNLLVNFC